jgi:hypothetical protein
MHEHLSVENTRAISCQYTTVRFVAFAMRNQVVNKRVIIKKFLAIQHIETVQMRFDILSIQTDVEVVSQQFSAYLEGVGCEIRISLTENLSSVHQVSVSNFLCDVELKIRVLPHKNLGQVIMK